MKFDPPRQWQPGSDDDDGDAESLHNNLERAMDRAGRDPSKHKAMWKTLSKSQLHVLMPYHPEMEGQHQMREGESLPIMHVMDDEGPYVPVFASHNRAVAAARALHKRCCVASMPSEAVFKTLALQKVRIVINPHAGPRLSMQPDTVKAFANGEMVSSNGTTGVAERVALSHIATEDLPPEIVQSLRDFGDRQRSIIGIYAFNAVDEKRQEPVLDDLRILLWVRQSNPELYGDFVGTFTDSLPDGMRGGIAIVDGSTPEAVDFVRKFKPIWPVLE
jgi:hypothetical protein